MLPRPTSIDPLVAGLAVHPVRYEQGAYNQPMQDTAERNDETAPPLVDDPSDPVVLLTGYGIGPYGAGPYGV